LPAALPIRAPVLASWQLLQALWVVVAAPTRVSSWQSAQLVVPTVTIPLWSVATVCVASQVPAWQLVQSPGADLPAALPIRAPVLAS
jgi:hypothetical protein